MAQEYYEGKNGTADDISAAAQKTAQGVKKTADMAARIKRAKAAATGATAAAGNPIIIAAKAKYIALGLACAIGFLIIVSVFWAAPTALWERLQGFNDAYEETYYSQDINNGLENTVGLLKAFFSGVKSVINTIWNSITGTTKVDENTGDMDVANDDDLLSMGEEDPLLNQFQKKIDAVINKYSIRTKKLKESVDAQYPSLNAWVAANNYPRDRAAFNSEEVAYEKKWNNIRTETKLGTDGKLYTVHKGYSTDNDMFIVSYDKLYTSWNVQPMSNNTAINLIAMCSAQFNNSITNIKPSQLMKWLGYYEGGEGPQVSNIGGTGIAAAPLANWTGIFMPQYLVDEMVQNPEGDYSKYGAPALDAIIEFSSPVFAGLSPHVTDVERSVYVNYTYPERYITDYEYSWQTINVTKWGWLYESSDTVVPEQYIRSVDRYSFYVGKRSTTNGGARIYYGKYISREPQWLPDYDKPLYGWQDTTEAQLQTQKIKVISYTAAYTISAKPVSILLSMVNFYDGEAKMFESFSAPLEDPDDVA